MASRASPGNNNHCRPSTKKSNIGTNILVNMLVLTGLLRFVLKMPDSLVFGRILPALLCH
jgi:hypothetical protein